ncbi:hypothetical protein H8E52_06985 [bacterium]|nr:hypothetical protein [bacterium]
MTDLPAWREGLIVAALALLAVIGLMSRSDLVEAGHPNFERPWDHHKYIHMADGGAFDFRVAPFCWRVGVPLAVSVLPLEHRDSFLIIAALGILVAGLMLYYAARRYGFSPRLSAAGMLLFFSLGWASKYNLMHFWLSDAAALGIVGLVILLILERRMLWAAFLLALGVMVKESIIFVAPLLYTLRTRRLLDGRLVLHSILYALPALALLVSIRSAIPMGNGDANYLATLPENLRAVHHGVSDFDMAYLWREHGLRRLTAPSLLSLKEMSIWSWGPLVLLIPFFVLRRPREIFLRFLPLFILAYAQILLASNVQRLVVLASAAVILPGLAVLQHWGRWLRAGEGCWIALAAGLLALNLLDPASYSAAFPVQLLYFTAFILILLLARRFRIFAPEGGIC